jgi:hypothetical protein
VIHRLPLALSAEEQGGLRRWIDACHRASPSRSHIKDEGLIALGGAVVSEAGIAPDAYVGARGAIDRLVGAFLGALEAHFAEEHRFVREVSRRLQYNVLSYAAAPGGGVTEGVPYHQDRCPTTILFGCVVTRPAEGGALEVLDLASGKTERLEEEGWALVFDDRACLHRVHDMRGARQALTLRVW